MDALSRQGQSNSQARVRSEATLKDGALFLQNIAVSPQTVDPGNPITVSVTASNGQLSVQGSGNPDCCGPACGLPGTWATNGYTYEIIAEVGSQGDATGEFCLGTTEVGTFDRSHELNLTAPQTPGNYTLTLTLLLTGSGDSAQTTRQLTVNEPDEPDDGGGGGGGGGGSGGDTINLPGIGPVPRNQAVLGGAALLTGAGALILSRDGSQRQRRKR